MKMKSTSYKVDTRNKNDKCSYRFLQPNYAISNKFCNKQTNKENKLLQLSIIQKYFEMFQIRHKFLFLLFILDIS